MEIGFRNSYIFLLSVGKRPVVLQVMTSFFLEEPTNIKDAWKIHIKFALDFFNSIKTIIYVCASRIYISIFKFESGRPIGSIELYQSWLKENNNARGLCDIFVSCHSLFLLGTFHVAKGVVEVDQG